ncbi:MAG TPA: hypothetical protein VMQ76_01385 [Terracidiphilus sp.]|jgi:hypothetical protein|nr:hypothetical protein [Terracidiphilus sp.]
MKICGVEDFPARRRLDSDDVKQGLRLLIYVLCAALGYLAGHLFLTGDWAVFVSILVSYHLFLGYLVLTAEHKTGFSLPVGSTILTHSACLVIIVCLGIGGRYVPFFGLIGLFVPALAPFECEWLFSTGKPEQVVKASAPVNTAFAEANREDYAEWMAFVVKQKSPFPRPGNSLPAEYERWLNARNKSRSFTQ